MIPTQSILKAYKSNAEPAKTSRHLLDVMAENGLKNTTSKTSPPKSFPELLRQKLAKQD